VEALRVLAERKIDELILVNARREPAGLVDSQDLTNLKIM
jgi:predicted transcriptional regulator